jgi:transposase
MAKTYRPYVPEQDFLLPPNLRSWLPEDHLAYFVSDLVDHLDLSAITTVYEAEDRGYPPYHPVMMTKVLVYAYCVGVFSSRRIQRRLLEDIPFRMLAAGNEPDFRTIAEFRKTHLTALEGLFEQVLRLAYELGVPRVGRVAIDGSKIKANVEAQGDELRPAGREATAAAARGEGLARAGGRNGCGRGRAGRGRSARRRSPDGAAAS